MWKSGEIMENIVVLIFWKFIVVFIFNLIDLFDRDNVKQINQQIQELKISQSLG